MLVPSYGKIRLESRRVYKQSLFIWVSIKKLHPPTKRPLWSHLAEFRDQRMSVIVLNEAETMQHE